MEEERVIQSENEFSNDVVTSNFDSSDAEFAKTTEQPLTDEEMRNCKYCSYQAPDWPLFAVHVLKPSHVKKVAEAMKVRVAIDPILTNITCEVCDVTCCGHIPWNAHLMGAKHRKAREEQDEMLKRKKNTAGGPIRNTPFGNIHNKKPYDRRPNNQQQTMNIPHTRQEDDFSTYSQPLIGLEFVTETDHGSKLRWYHCSLCDVKFDDNLKFPHLVGQKHRLNVLKLKRPAVVEGIESNGKKRSEITPILLREAEKLEVEEGRQHIISSFPKQNPTAGRGFKRGRGSNRGARGARGTIRGGRGNRGTSNTRGRGNIMGQYSTQRHQSNYSTYNDPQRNSYSSDLPHNSAYNVNNPEHGRNFQQSYNGDQSQYGSGQSYSSPGQSYSHTDNTQSSFSQNTPFSGLVTKTGINSNLAAALSDLTKLIQSEEDASVALSVSNALTESLINFRTTGLERQ